MYKTLKKQSYSKSTFNCYTCIMFLYCGIIFISITYVLSQRMHLTQKRFVFMVNFRFEKTQQTRVVPLSVPNHRTYVPSTSVFLVTLLFILIYSYSIMFYIYALIHTTRNCLCQVLNIKITIIACARTKTLTNNSSFC